MSTRRRVAVFLGVFALVCIAVLALTPLLFRGPIEARVKAAIGNNVDARVGWKHVGLNIFRHFPDVTLRLDQLAVTGNGHFSGDTLLSVPGFRLVLDLGSVLRNLRGPAPIVVRALELDGPALRLIVLPDGSANWDILRSSGTPPGAPRPFQVSLRGLEIRGGRLSMDNRQDGLLASMIGVSESLSGDFSRQRFTLRTHTSADTVSLRFAGVPYLKRVRLELKADLDVDGVAKRVAVKDNLIRLNDLALGVSGSVAAAPDSSLVLDLAFASARTEFKDILSLVPVIYSQSFASLQTSGTMSVAGWVRGRYAARTFPALALEARVENGMFRYPELALPARDVFFDLALANPGGSLDNTVVNLKRFHALLGNNPVDGSFAMRTPVSDPDVDLRLKGRVDLADVPRTVKLEGLEKLTGLVVADVAMRARMSDLDQKRYERVTAGGSIDLSGMELRAKSLPRAVQVSDASLRLAPEHAQLTAFHGMVGSSDLAATGFVDNLLGFVLRGQQLRGQASVSSTHLDLNEWRSKDKVQAIPVPGNVDFALQATVARLTYGQLELRNARGSARVKDQRLTLQDFRMDMLGGSMAMTGFYETTNIARPTFDFDLHATDLDVPGAFSSIKTVQAFVPVAHYAQGRASADLRLNGALGTDMVPVASVLSGLGSFRTAGLVLKGFPPMDKLAELLKIPQLRNPGLTDLQSSVEIKDGKLRVKPFNVKIGQLAMNVSGANGIDQSLLYTLALKLPRSALGAEANRALTGILARSKQAGVDLNAADIVTLGVQLAGTVTQPSLSTDLRAAADSSVQVVAQALRQEAGRRLDTVKQRLDTAAAAARRRAEAESARLIADAEQRAAAIRQQARTLADALRQEAGARADSLAARPTSALGRMAAKAAADRVRKQADARADQMLRQADARADSLVASARSKASDITGH